MAAIAKPKCFASFSLLDQHSFGKNRSVTISLGYFTYICIYIYSYVYVYLASIFKISFFAEIQTYKKFSKILYLEKVRQCVINGLKARDTAYLPSARLSMCTL